jgi:WhiB family redox-sensing transcriptional regulator
MTNKTRNRTYNVRQVASILGVSTDRVSREIRVGTIRAEKRRGRIVVTEQEVVRLLDGTQAQPGHSDTGVAHLRYRDVPTDVLVDIVRHGCRDPLSTDSPPDGDSDTEVARQTCASCSAPLACLALEFRIEGRETVGVWGALSEQDRRALFAAWAADTGAGETGYSMTGGEQ